MNWISRALNGMTFSYRVSLFKGKGRLISRGKGVNLKWWYWAVVYIVQFKNFKRKLYQQNVAVLDSGEITHDWGGAEVAGVGTMDPPKPSSGTPLLKGNFIKRDWLWTEHSPFMSVKLGCPHTQKNLLDFLSQSCFRMYVYFRHFTGKRDVLRWEKSPLTFCFCFTMHRVAI